MTQLKPLSGRKTEDPKKGRRKRGQAECFVPDCGRPVYSGELCQTHHRQKCTTGKLKPIRPYRKRTPGNVKFGGLRLTPFCASKIEKYAAKRNISTGAAIAELLEDWVQQGAP